MCVLNTCAATWCKMNMFIYNICRHIKIWSCKQIFKCEKSLHIFSAFNPSFYPQKEYKRVLEWKIPNLKLAWEEEVKVFLKFWCGCNYPRHANIEQIKFERTYVSDLVNLVSLWSAPMVGKEGNNLEICCSRLWENTFASTRTAKNIP